MLDVSGSPAVTYLCAFYFCTQGCGRDRRSGIPCALSGGTRFCDNSGISVPREGNAMSIARRQRQWAPSPPVGDVKSALRAQIRGSNKPANYGVMHKTEETSGSKIVPNQ